jgi:hypothetical protein
MDIARWGLGVTLPVKISAVGVHFMFDDDQQTPNDLIATFEFPNPQGVIAHQQFPIKTKTPNRQPYPEELVSYGDHLRKRRLDLI